MKKIILLAVNLLFAIMVPAQGIYQLWGMTNAGGYDDGGIIFSTNAVGNNFQVRYQFSDKPPGTNPMYTDPILYNGKFYGMTSAGGSNNLGVIFEWDPVSNVYTKKIDFSSSIGSKPNGSLTLVNGKFYGMTRTGGSSGRGVIFEWDPATNIYNKRIDFNSDNGGYPNGNLTQSGGKFYGMTTGGGNNYGGTIFEWDPLTNLHMKKVDLNNSTGIDPGGSLTLKDGKFYGMTMQGGSNDVGVIFEWDPVSNLFIKKIDFSMAIGRWPNGSLAFSGGKFYGMTNHGGSDDGGVIFDWDPVTNVYNKRIDFNGNNPNGSLTWKNGKFYGLTSAGGDRNKGVLFEWDPLSNLYIKKIDLSEERGSSPNGSLTQSGGKFYGMTTGGGNNNGGTIFEWDPSTNVYTKMHNFELNNGKNPMGSLKMNGGKFYGMAEKGGGSNSDIGEGVIFEYDPSTNLYTKKIGFIGTNGSNPIGNLTLKDGKYYGMTELGGSKDKGVIFEWNPITNVYTKKKEFQGTDGGEPYGSLTLCNGKFYGMTRFGGSNNMGTIFEWDPITNLYTKKKDFNSADGTNTYGSLILNSGKFFGMTSSGGSNDMGVIFEWDPAANGYIKKRDFNSTDGANPYGNFTLGGGKFYGMTMQGGSNDAGVIFEWNPLTNVYLKKKDFNSSDGSNPAASLTLSSGKFYGMTMQGGSNDGGVLFEWDPATNLYNKKKDFNGPDGKTPILNDLTLASAPIAKGLPGSCVSFPSVSIGNSNNNEWVPIVDNLGDAVAEIKANGNNLGIVNSSMYINSGALREDGLKNLFLDRNLTITPQVQPASAVDIRIYIKGSEYLALKNALNSNGQPSGISSINDVGIFKNANSCLPAIEALANPVAATAAAWEADYVLSASISSFSSFYFANKNLIPLPLTLLEFNGRILNNNSLLNWKTDNELNTAHFEIERSPDGISYSVIGTLKSANTAGVHDYSFIDPNISAMRTTVVYYRLKQIDMNGRFTLSRIVALSIDNSNFFLLYPNPVTEKINLTITIKQPQQVQANVIDINGKTIIRQQWKLSAGSTSFSLDLSRLAKGMYYLELKGATFNERKKFVKQ